MEHFKPNNMKTLFTCIALFISLLVNAQEFMGVKVEGSRSQITEAFKAKGFTVLQNSPENNVVTMKGTVNSNTVELYASFTPRSNKCWALTVFLPEKTSWYSLKDQYKDYLNILIEKYGEPNNKYSFFSSPYYEGDGYELQAVRLEKCTYSAFWSNVSIQISKFKQVKIHYENATNAALDDEEKKKVNLNNF
jgi:hypothetical protein